LLAAVWLTALRWAVLRSLAIAAFVVRMLPVGRAFPG